MNYQEFERQQRETYANRAFRSVGQDIRIVLACVLCIGCGVYWLFSDKGDKLGIIAGVVSLLCVVYVMGQRDRKSV